VHSMKKCGLFVVQLAFAACSGWAQTGNVVVGGGYSTPVPFPVAPGQVITLLVKGIGADLTQTVKAQGTPLPTILGGISVTFRQTASVPFPQSAALPLLEVDPRVSTCRDQPFFAGDCGRLAAITLQIPFEMNPNFPRFDQTANEAFLVVSEGGVAGGIFELEPEFDRIHIITNCGFFNPLDTLLPFSSLCGPVVTDGTDGPVVTAANPARSGEVLSMWAFGLGSTVPAVKSGEAAPAPAPTLAQTPLISFDFRKNTAPQRVEEPTPVQPALLFAGLARGYVGLCQINFRVPPVPKGLPKCNIPSGPAQILAVLSNLTVTVSETFSFDGSAICVDPGS